MVAWMHFRKEVVFVKDMFLMKIFGHKDPEGALLVHESFTNDITQACRTTYDMLGEPGRFIAEFHVMFRRDENGRQIKRLAIRVYFTEQGGEKAHFTRWFPYLETTTDIRPTKEEIVERLFAPLEEICKARQT